jgi:ech hydrogenase subunit F
MPEMLKEILKNLFSKPATVLYPFEQPEPLPNTRGEVEFDMTRCDQCQDCQRVCPSGAITVYPDEKKIEYEPYKCMYCHLCIENCMQEAISHSLKTKASYTKDVRVFETES